MGARLDKNPGEFTLKANRAGASLFVEPELLNGTLLKGLDLLRSLEAPFPRAVFTMFLVSEVHPFADGNGRTGRIMMNQELTAGGEERIISPTVYRNNYIAALKALTHNSNPDPIIRVLDFAWRWTAAMDWNDFDAIMRQLSACHAFEEADGDGIRLRMPEPI